MGIAEWIIVILGWGVLCFILIGIVGGIGRFVDAVVENQQKQDENFKLLALALDRNSSELRELKKEEE